MPGWRWWVVAGDGTFEHTIGTEGASFSYTYDGLTTSCRRDCHSAAPPSTFRKCFNVDGERALRFSGHCSIGRCCHFRRPCFNNCSCSNPWFGAWVGGWSGSIDGTLSTVPGPLTGDWEKDIREGQGELAAKFEVDGSASRKWSYKGSWSRGSPHGSGVLHNTDGSVFNG